MSRRWSGASSPASASGLIDPPTLSLARRARAGLFHLRKAACGRRKGVGGAQPIRTLTP